MGMLRKLWWTVPLTLFLGFALLALIATLDAAFEIALHAPEFR